MIAIPREVAGSRVPDDCFPARMKGVLIDADRDFRGAVSIRLQEHALLFRRGVLDMEHPTPLQICFMILFRRKDPGVPQRLLFFGDACIPDACAPGSDMP